MRSNSPIPLGGTSNHLRRSVLDEIGGAWDPFNVTEDADLGVRIAESGYRTAVLNSTTLEEANSDTINWIRQRSRWYKAICRRGSSTCANPSNYGEDWVRSAFSDSRFSWPAHLWSPL